MRPVFNFAVIRPPRPADRRRAITFPGQLTLLRRDLNSARDRPDPAAAMRAAAEQFLNGEEFLDDPAGFPLGGQLLDLRDRVRDMEDVSIASLRTALRRATSRGSQELVASEDFRALRDRAFDAVMALRILPNRFPRLVPVFAGLVRMMDLVQRLDDRDPTLARETPATLLRRTIVLPRRLFPIPRSLQPAAVSSSGVPSGTGSVPRADVRTLTRRLDALDRARAAILSASAGDFTRGDGQVRLHPDALARLPASVREVLVEMEVDIAAVPVGTALDRIAAAGAPVARELADARTRRESPGAATIVTARPPALPAEFPGPDDAAQPEPPTVPHTVGLVGPIAIMPLMVVEGQVKAYELDAVSHADSIQQSASQTRETRRLNRTEETFETETERTTEQERHQETTDKNEVEQEIGKTIEEVEKFNVGATISGSYGPIKAELSTGFESEFSTEESRKSAATYVREVVEKTVFKLTERVREKRTRTTLQEFEEKYTHGFDNTNGSSHINAVYQFLTKVMQYEIRRKGDRLMIEVYAPEPAENFLYSQGNGPQHDPPPKPFTAVPADITPQTYGEYVREYNVTDIDAPPDFYVTLSETFEGTAQIAEGEELPPPITEAKDVDVPQGYRAVEAYAVAALVQVPPDDPNVPTGGARVLVSVGRNELEVVGSDGDVFTLDAETGDSPTNLPVTVLVEPCLGYTVGLEVFCVLTAAALEEWRIKTHAAILRAYLAQKADYQERLALLAERNEDAPGRHPLENEAIIRTELQRNAIEVMTGQHFDLFGAIQQLPGQRPQIDFEEAFVEGNYVSAFSRWFEWHNMVWVFQPWFWARKETWDRRLLLSDVDPQLAADPQFAAFVRAGGVRMQIPVRPGFEEFVLAFLETGTVPQNDPAGVIGEDYLSIVEEIKDSLGVGERGELIDSFEFRLPTTLHMIRTAPGLPAWAPDEDGNWVPVEALQDG